MNLIDESCEFILNEIVNQGVALVILASRIMLLNVNITILRKFCENSENLRKKKKSFKIEMKMTESYFENNNDKKKRNKYKNYLYQANSNNGDSDDGMC